MPSDVSASPGFLQPLPPAVELETVAVLRALAAANRALAELKGRAATIPNQGILIDTLALQEAKASSEIENIVTTQDELFQLGLFPDGLESGAAKEVARYRDALKLGLTQLLETGGLIRNATLIDMYRFLKARSDGFRSTPGTTLMNDRTGEVIYVPPQDRNEIITAMSSLEAFINDDEICQLDPLIKMALIHHQFESIHPFADGNGRIGRILNVLYLAKTGLLDIPILYLSHHINQHKAEYYRLLQSVREEGDWEAWVLYMLEAVEKTSRTTLALVEGIRHAHQPRCDRPVPLGGMGPIGCHIQAIVQQVDGAGDQAEGHQRTYGRQPDVCLKAEGEQGRSKHQQVFGPLARAAGSHQRRQGARTASSHGCALPEPACG